MSYIQVPDHRYINSTHIVEFTYRPASSIERTEKDKADWGGGIGKTVEKSVESSLSITLTLGKTLSFCGADADRIKDEIIGPESA